LAPYSEHVALDLALGPTDANRFLQARLDDGVVGRQKVPRIVPTNRFSRGKTTALEWSYLLIYLTFFLVSAVGIEPTTL
jgi:hypothetical protein